ncbi:MAG: hypothetical protein A4E48_00584 [Methanosaeta sp. PtaU1.Bin060]|nr:MAG: hypothetical protein A4E48_00584 [Methanosaeta sp. PtaU1.Bin060]
MDKGSIENAKPKGALDEGNINERINVRMSKWLPVLEKMTSNEIQIREIFGRSSILIKYKTGKVIIFELPVKKLAWGNNCYQGCNFPGCLSQKERVIKGRITYINQDLLSSTYHGKYINILEEDKRIRVMDGDNVILKANKINKGMNEYICPASKEKHKISCISRLQHGKVVSDEYRAMGSSFI